MHTHTMYFQSPPNFFIVFDFRCYTYLYLILFLKYIYSFETFLWMDVEELGKKRGIKHIILYFWLKQTE